MADFFNSLNQLFKKDLVSNIKDNLENPNNFSENIISYLKKNNIDLSSIIDIVENEKPISHDPIKEEKINNQDVCNEYENLFSRLNNIENTMTEIQDYLKNNN